MDDVYVIVGLLLFGSLLFCLCCYKVSNLLYMLYHIDDTESEDELTPEFAKEVVNNAVAAEQYQQLLGAGYGSKSGTLQVRKTIFLCAYALYCLTLAV